MNRILRFSLPILLTITTGSVSWAQLGTFDDLRLKGPAPNIVFAPADNDSDRFRILARSGGESLDIDRPGLDCVVRIFRDANAEALLIDGNGVRINETFSLGSATPLLEFNDGVDTWALGIDSGQFSIRAANGNDLLVLQNDRVVANQTIRVSDAQPRYQFDRNGLVWDLEVDETNILNIDSPTDFNIFEIDGQAAANSFHIGQFGVGIGTDTPSFPGLHIRSEDFGTFQDATLVIENAESNNAAREQLRLKNNGPARFALEDTNLGVTWSLITTFNDAFQIRKNGPGTSNMTIRADGTFAFANSGQSNFTLFPDGNAFLRGTLNQGSDRHSKKNFGDVDREQILAQVLELPISTWTYKTEADHVRHLGPMSQDFHRLFSLGVNNKTISTLDSSGVALAAIQGLHSKLEQKNEEIESLHAELKKSSRKLEQTQAEVVEQQHRIDELTERMNRLEAMLSNQRRQ